MDSGVCLFMGGCLGDAVRTCTYTTHPSPHKTHPLTRRPLLHHNTRDAPRAGRPRAAHDEVQVAHAAAADEGLFCVGVGVGGWLDRRCLGCVRLCVKSHSTPNRLPYPTLRPQPSHIPTYLRPVQHVVVPVLHRARRERGGVRPGVGLPGVGWCCGICMYDRCGVCLLGGGSRHRLNTQEQHHHPPAQRKHDTTRHTTASTYNGRTPIEIRPPDATHPQPQAATLLPARPPDRIDRPPARPSPAQPSSS